MAERIQVELVDDIDGSPAQQTVTFALDGVTYEIDLSEQHAQALRSVLSRYIDRARSPQRSSGSRQQESEERRNRQANRQLTEQIRGAARRSRERLSQQAAAAPAEEEAVAEEPLFAQTPPPVPEGKPGEDKSRVPAVALPQFFSGVD
jgi:hypothetical protein